MREYFLQERLSEGSERTARHTAGMGEDWWLMYDEW